MAHWMRGIYRLQLASDEKRFHRVELLTTRHGLPTNRNNVVSMVDGDPIFSTEGGLLHLQLRLGALRAGR